MVRRKNIGGASYKTANRTIPGIQDKQHGAGVARRAHNPEVLRSKRSVAIVVSFFFCAAFCFEFRKDFSSEQTLAKAKHRGASASVV